ncbi:hypothetical protein [Actinomadura decatromicini]|uniref:Uncharacterized protein n=1 Tax=Actinomadura decatromicini TaxID=2604572 RepID=A0A5D3F6Y0_9ACTN|nr:hypothetical protein [Actinomadura decatromicini]TYK44061.1 hypothetical protein FXF68_35705 [Actinomadura decatromicini]
MRMRSALLALTMATFGTGVLSTGTANAAPLKASITCDSASNRISTRLTGALVPNFTYTVKFTVWTGSRVTTGGAISSLPELGSSVSVPMTTGSDPNVDVAGYTRSWNAADYAYYGETVRVTVLNPNGGTVAERDASCSQDKRVTVQLRCAPEAHTVTATTAGVNFLGNRSVWTEYVYSTTSQSSADGLRFTRHNISGRPDVTHSVTVPESGQWSDTGYVHELSGDPYYYDETVTVIVRDRLSNLVVGQGTAYCVYADNRISTPTARGVTRGQAWPDMA